MTVDPPPQRPEGKLLQDALQTTGRSIRQVAAEAGMSDARWRQLVKGSMNKGGHVVEEIAPAHTLARMAQVVGVTAEQLRHADRPDAASALESLTKGSKGGGLQVVASIHAGHAADEIDLIYESSMSATQKLEAIRKVLLLRAQADAEKAAKREQAAQETKENGRT